jgi:hypothetical protein
VAHQWRAVSLLAQPRPHRVPRRRCADRGARMAARRHPWQEGFKIIPARSRSPSPIIAAGGQSTRIRFTGAMMMAQDYWGRLAASLRRCMRGQQCANAPATVGVCQDQEKGRYLGDLGVSQHPGTHCLGVGGSAVKSSTAGLCIAGFRIPEKLLRGI